MNIEHTINLRMCWFKLQRERNHCYQEFFMVRQCHRIVIGTVFIIKITF